MKKLSAGKVSKKMPIKNKMKMKIAQTSTLLEIGEDIVDLIIKMKNYKKMFKNNK